MEGGWGAKRVRAGLLKRALEVNRNQNVALLNLGANLIRQGKGADAVSVMEEAIKRSDNAPTRTRYGFAPESIFATSQRRTVRSELPEASIFASGEKAIWWTAPVWPRSSATG